MFEYVVRLATARPVRIGRASMARGEGTEERWSGGDKWGCMIAYEIEPAEPGVLRMYYELRRRERLLEICMTEFP